MNVTIYFDGACEPKNPGGVATAGWIILGDNDEPLGGDCCVICRGEGATNNVAEWAALGKALRHVADSGLQVGTLQIYGDSMLVVNQLTGNWNCNKEHLQKLRDRCKELISQINPSDLVVEWIPREQNEEADALSRKAYEEATGKKFPVRVR
jgi:ribonuclease HI